MWMQLTFLWIIFVEIYNLLGLLLSLTFVKSFLQCLWNQTFFLIKSKCFNSQKSYMSLFHGLIALSIIVLLSYPVSLNTHLSPSIWYVLSYRNGKPLDRAKLNYHLNFSLITWWFTSQNKCELFIALGHMNSCVSSCISSGTSKHCFL